MLKNALKTMAYVGTAATTSVAATTLMAVPAYAVTTWSPQDMTNQIGANTGVKVNTINQDTVSNAVKVISNWVVGIFVCIFVLKLVFTAVADALVGVNDDGNSSGRTSMPGGRNPGGDHNEFILYNLGFLSAYNMKPKDALLHKFLPNIAFCLGAWLVVQLGLSAVMWLFSGVITPATS